MRSYTQTDRFDRLSPASASLSGFLPLPALIIFRHCEPPRPAIVSWPGASRSSTLSTRSLANSGFVVDAPALIARILVAIRLGRIMARRVRSFVWPSVETLTGSCARSIPAKRYLGGKKIMTRSREREREHAARFGSAKPFRNDILRQKHGISIEGKSLPKLISPS